MTFKECAGVVFYVRDFGGPGSGNFGHAGRPGERGGSASSGSGGGKSVSRAEPPKLSSRTIGQDMYSGGLDIDMAESDFISRGYTPEEAKTILAYKENAYVNINKAAITGDCKKYDCSGVSKMDKIIADSKIVGGATVYHGMGETEAALFDGVDVGSEFKNSAFYSTTLDSGIATKFSDGGKVLVIDLPHGANGFYYGDTKYESEVILPRNQKYSVNKIEDKDGKKFYHVSPVAS